MKKTASWISDEPVPDVALLTQSELLDVWAGSRNSTLAVMASEEIVRRLYKQREEEYPIEAKS